MHIVVSRHNQRFRELLKAKDDKTFLFLEGKRLIEDAISRGFMPRMAAATPEYIAGNGRPSFPHMVVSEGLFHCLSETKTPQGILVFIDRPYVPLEDVAQQEKIIVLDGLQDPGNVGTIIRTAEAFGIKGVIVTARTASPFSEKAVRASMGSFLGVNIAAAEVKDLKTLDHRIVSLVLHGRIPLRKDMLQGRIAICFGQEGSGISEDLLAMSHETVFIPMQGPTESLNVAVAAGIVMACIAGVL
jgi:TrmH family RNA methyltransferase